LYVWCSQSDKATLSNHATANRVTNHLVLTGSPISFSETFCMSQHQKYRSSLFMEELSLVLNQSSVLVTFLEWFATATFVAIKDMVPSAMCRISLFLFAAAFAQFSSLAQEVEITQSDSGKFIGATGCNSSSCHGGAGEKRNQYLTWSQKDFHTRGYPILTTARSTRMAETLNLPAAPESHRCTVCHSPFQGVEPARLGPTAHPDEGVSCESCHNAAGPWLRGHTRKDWTYAMRVTAGMRDLKSFYVRANTCVACHQNLDSDLLKAGHPELTFELDGQSVAEPKHWRDDDPQSGLRAWLVGQAVALREMSWALSKNGTPDAEEINRWKGLAWLLAKATAQQTNLPVIGQPGGTTSPVVFTAAQEQADFLARRAAESQLTNDLAQQLLRTLAATDSEFVISKEVSADLLFRYAQRLLLALDRLSVAVLHEAPGKAKNPVLTQLFDDVRSRGDFQVPRFVEHLRSFRATLSPTKR
jgi:Cytochrome c554 and c-prime